MMKNIRENKGITLIALVITIVILIILAAVAINLSIGENGIITRAKYSIERSKYETAKEKLMLTIADIRISFEEQQTPFNIVTLGDRLESEDITDVYMEKYLYEDSAAVRLNANINKKSLATPKALVVSVKNYDDYNFCIDRDGEIQGVTKNAITDETKPEDFTPINEFEVTIGESPKGNNDVNPTPTPEPTPEPTPIPTPEPTPEPEALSASLSFTANHEMGLVANNELSMATTAALNATAESGIENVTLTIGSYTVYTENLSETQTSYSKTISVDNMTNLEYLTFNGVQSALLTVTSKNGNTQNSLPISMTNLTVGNAAQLQAFATAVNNGTSFQSKVIYQTKDISLASVCGSSIGSWNPIGTNGDTPFSGRYNGAGHTITDLYVNRNNKLCGLFGKVVGTASLNAAVKDLTVYGSVTGTYYVGGIVGSINYTTIKNCNNYATITSTGYEPTYSLSGTGGIAGQIHPTGGTINNCTNYGIVSGTYNGIGGIVGWAINGNVTNCTNNHTLNCSTWAVGGIVGRTSKYDQTEYFTTISNCINNSAITGTYNVGGILSGGSYFTITQCTNKGNITATSNNGTTNSSACVGGIAGIVGGTANNVQSNITYCYNTATITSNHRGIGGIIGCTDTTTFNLNHCYNIGDIYNNASEYKGKTGGIIGWKISGTLNISSCYELTGCVKVGNDNEKLNESGKVDASTIKGLNWSYFTVKSGLNSGYPVFTWE